MSHAGRPRGGRVAPRAGPSCGIYGEADFLRLVLTPASERTGATMPALSGRLSEGERRRIADAMLDYLKAVSIQP